MRPATYRSIFALALVGFVAVGIGLVRSAAGPHSDALAEAPEIVGALSATRMLEGRQMLPLSDEERAQIFDHVMRTPDVPVADVEPPDAATVPAGVALQELPAGAAQDVPLAEGHKFVKLDDRILLVHPGSRQVVAEMPRYKLVLQ